MAEQNSGNINFNKEELPIPIPPADQAWESMRQKLDAELPVEGNSPVSNGVHHVWIKALLVVAVAVSSVVVWKYLRSSHDPKQSVGVVNSEDTATSQIINENATTSHMTGKEVIEQSGISVTSSQAHVVPSQDQGPSLPDHHSIQDPFTKTANIQSIKSSISDIQVNVPTAEQKSSKTAVTSKSHTSKFIIAQPLPEQLNVDTPCTADDTITEQSPSKSIAAKETFTEGITPKSTSASKQHVIAADHAAENTAQHPQLQLSFIQSPVAGYNTKLIHTAEPFIPHQISSKNKEARWALYVQLNAAIPIYGGKYYSMGPDGKDQFYRTLIPSARIERKLWKGALSLDIQPSLNAIPKFNKQRDTVDSQWTPLDTSRSLLKQLGWGAGLQYQLNIRSHWQVGAGIQAAFLRKAVMQQYVADSMGVAKRRVSAATAADRKDLSSIRISGVAKLDYMMDKWQFGLRGLVPLTPASKSGKVSAQPVNVELVIRRRLLRK